MAAQYPPYQRAGGLDSEASFDHHAHAYNHPDSSSANLNSGEKSAALGAGGFKGANSSGRMASSSSKKKYVIGGIILGLLIAIGAVLGGVLGTQLNKDKEGSGTRDAAVKVVAVGTTTDSNGKKQTVSSTTTSSAASSASSAAAAVPSVSPLPEWKWTQSAYAAAQSSGNGEPMYGAALGNWLVLEAWMNEPCELVCLVLHSHGSLLLTPLS